MIITRLQGGMGNQMFQYALGRSLAIQNNVPLGLDTTFLLDRTPIPNFTFRDYSLEYFNIEASVAQRDQIPFLYRKYPVGVFMRYIDYIRRKLLPTIGKEKKNYHFDPNILNLGPNVYLEGWWQSYKYFEKYKDVIKKDFNLKNPPASNIQKLADEIAKVNSLCMHIRRGDYVGNKNHEVVNTEYYKKSLEYIKNNTKIDHIYIFSDDIKWCKENIKFEFPTTFVGDEYAGYKDEGHMYLMNKCHNFIIANSSFSWWGAWLAEYHNKIIVAPKYWLPNKNIDTQDLVPDNWIRL
jgi:hypothetical protein